MAVCRADDRALRCHLACRATALGDAASAQPGARHPEGHVRGCSYDIELLEFEPPEEDKEQGMMTFEERLEAAERRRLEGNELFKGDKFKEALRRYR